MVREKKQSTSGKRASKPAHTCNVRIVQWVLVIVFMRCCVNVVELCCTSLITYHSDSCRTVMTTSLTLLCWKLHERPARARHLHQRVIAAAAIQSHHRPNGLAGDLHEYSSIISCQWSDSGICGGRSVCHVMFVSVYVCEFWCMFAFLWLCVCVWVWHRWLSSVFVYFALNRFPRSLVLNPLLWFLQERLSQEELSLIEIAKQESLRAAEVA